MSSSSASGVANLSNAQNTIVIIKEEREAQNADPGHPIFLRGHQYNKKKEEEWTRNVLKQVALMTFVIASGPDLEYFSAIVKADPPLRDLYKYVTKVRFTGFHWFSGVAHNRNVNPYLTVCTLLPNLRELGITLHTAALTTSRWNEREKVRLEGTELGKSKELRVLRLGDIITKFALKEIFELKNLQTVKIEVLESPMVKHFTKIGDPLSLVSDLMNYIRQGHENEQGRTLQVTREVREIPDWGN